MLVGSIRESLQRERNVRESIDVKELGSRLTQDRLDINVLNSVSYVCSQIPGTLTFVLTLDYSPRFQGMQVHQHAIKELRRRVDRLAQQAEEINNVWQTCVEVLKTAHEQKASGGSMVSQHATFYREYVGKSG